MPRTRKGELYERRAVRRHSTGNILLLVLPALFLAALIVYVVMANS